MEVSFSISGDKVFLSDILGQWAESFASSMMDGPELLHLAAALAICDWQPDAILVEIGAYHGRTTAYMAHVLRLLGKKVPILSIDPFERVQYDAFNPQGSYLAYISTVRLHRVENSCLPLAAFSQDAAIAVPERVGVLVVDGCHHYPAVRSDLALYAPKVLPRGLIFVDDYGALYPDVMRAVDEYFVPGGPFRLLHKSYFVVARRESSEGQGVEKMGDVDPPAALR